MELLIMMALAYALGGGVTAGRETAAQHTKTPKPPKPIDRTETGKKIAQGAINSVARVYTFTSGAKEGWRKAWPETKTAITERRAKVKADKAERTAAKEAAKAAKVAGQPEPDEDGIVDAEIVEDEVVNTGGPKAPSPEKVAEAKEAADAAAKADATVHVHVHTDPPPTPAPAPASSAPPTTPPPAAAPASPAPVVPAPAAPADTVGAVPPAPGADYPPLRIVKDAEPAAGGGGTATATAPRSTMTNLPTATTLVTEVNGVESLMKYLAQLARWARMEKDDATAAVTRLTELRSKAEHALNAATAAKYDKKTLAELASIVEKLTELKTTREEDLRTSDLAERNAAQSSANVWARHGGMQEARNQSDVDMAETTTYGD
ncbi:hypothetical protein [Kitasatospora sp. NBC_01302]|uniref:hypothetical protein n=1 Tax=Kitasatospora sp. NBC_01302 TaxID=2903575 RepID=UPI002E153FB9|nr:hypothetical protein OG294_40020 [Kitasatospora sp. NBC_01302]